MALRVKSCNGSNCAISPKNTFMIKELQSERVLIIFKQYRNKHLPSGLVSHSHYKHASSFLVKLWCILVWETLANKLLGKKKCTHTPWNGNLRRTGHFEKDSHSLSHTVSIWWAILALLLWVIEGKLIICSKSLIHFLHIIHSHDQSIEKYGCC